MNNKEKVLQDLNLPPIDMNGVIGSLRQASDIMKVLVSNVSRLQGIAMAMNTNLTEHLIPREYWDTALNHDKKQQYISLPDETGWEKGFSFMEIIERLKQRPNNDMFVVMGNAIWLGSTLSFKLTPGGWVVYVLDDSESGYTVTNGEIIDTLNKLLAQELGLLLPLRADNSPLSMAALRKKKKLLDAITNNVKRSYQLLKEINLVTGKATTYDIPDQGGKFSYYLTDLEPVLKIVTPEHGHHTLSAIYSGDEVVICNANGVIDQAWSHSLNCRDCLPLAHAVDELTKSLMVIKGKTPAMTTTVGEAMALFNSTDMSHRYHLIKRVADIVIKFDHPELSTWHGIRIPYTLKLGISKELILQDGSYLPHAKVSDLCSEVIEAMSLMDREWSMEKEVTDYFFVHLLDKISKCFTNTAEVEVPFVRFDSTPIEIEIPNDNKHNTVFVHPEGLTIEDVNTMLSAVFNTIGMDTIVRDKEIVVRSATPVCDSKLKYFIYNRYQALNEL